MESELVKIGKKYYEGKDSFVEFTDDARINLLLNGNPNAFVLGCVMDKQIDASRAWAIPYKISKKLGT